MARLSKMAGALTQKEFEDALSQFPRLRDRSRQVARSILVDGMTFEEVNETFQTSRQLAHQWATLIYEAFRPEGWVTEAVTLPPDLMGRVREMERKARADWQESLQPARITRHPAGKTTARSA